MVAEDNVFWMQRRGNLIERLNYGILFYVRYLCKTDCFECD